MAENRHFEPPEPRPHPPARYFRRHRRPQCGGSALFERISPFRIAVFLTREPLPAIGPASWRGRTSQMTKPARGRRCRHDVGAQKMEGFREMAGTEKPVLGDTVVSARTAAALIGVTHPRVLQLTTEGWIKKNSKGQHTLQGVVEGYVAFLKAEERRTSKVQSESGLKAARQREVELRIAEREREVVPRDEAEAAMDLVIGKVNAEMNGLAARVTRDIEMRTKIETEVHASLQRISEALEAGSENLASGSPDAAADTEDDA